MRLILKNGGDPRVLIETAAAAILYGEEESKKQGKEAKTPEEILKQTCKLQESDILYKRILKAYKDKK